MPTYEITWRHEAEADSPREAAMQAFQFIRESAFGYISPPPTFEVRGPNDVVTEVNLADTTTPIDLS